MVALEVAKVGSVFPRFRASISKNCRKQVHETVEIERERELGLQFKMPKNGALLEDEVGKMCARLQRELELTKQNMFKRLRAADKCAEKFIWCDAPAIRDCNWRRNTLGQGCSRAVML
jgi:hypothetical protein